MSGRGASERRVPVAVSATDREQRRAILRARARALAEAPPLDARTTREVLEFVLAGERYMVETAWIREIVPLRTLTPLPCTPAFVLGVIALHGRIVSVLDVGRLFGLPERGLSDRDMAIVLGDTSMEFAVLADAVEGVRALPLDDIQPPLPTLTGIRAEYLLGVTRYHEVVLDGRRLLNDPAVVVAQEPGIPLPSNGRTSP